MILDLRFLFSPPANASFYILNFYYRLWQDSPAPPLFIEEVSAKLTEEFFHFQFSIFHFQLKYVVMVTFVPSFTFDSMLNRSQFFCMFGSPIPAPKPISRTSGEAVE